MLKKLSVVLVLLVLASCVPNKTISMESDFDKSEAAYVKNKGENIIVGSGLIRKQSGGVVTCAGYDVELFPITKYSSEMMQKVYDNKAKGYLASFYTVQNLDTSYHIYKKTTTCDAQGGFKFRSIADGDYYLNSTVKWTVFNPQLGEMPQGGNLMQRVSVYGGETKEIVLAP